MKLSCCIMMVLVLLASCSQPPIYKAEPLGKNSIWRSGKQIQYFENDDYTVFFNYEYIRDGKIGMYLEVVNNSNNILRVDPVGHTLEWRDSLSTSAPLTYISRSADPENEILAVEKQAKVDKENATVAAVFLAVLFVAAVAVAASANDDDNNSSSSSCSSNHDDCDTDIVYIDNSNPGTVRNEKAEKIDFYTNKYLRKTDLFSGERTSGYLEFPFNPYSSIFTAKVRLKDTIVPFDFKVSRVLY